MVEKKQKNKTETKKEDKKPVIYVQRLSDGEHFGEAVIVGRVPAFIVRDKARFSQPIR